MVVPSPKSHVNFLTFQFEGFYYNFYESAIFEELNFWLSQYFENIQLLEKKITNNLTVPRDNKMDDKSTLKFIQSLYNSDVSQNLIRALEVSDKGYIASFQSGIQKDLSIKDVSKIISRMK